MNAVQATFRRVVRTGMPFLLVGNDHVKQFGMARWRVFRLNEIDIGILPESRLAALPFVSNQIQCFWLPPR